MIDEQTICVCESRKKKAGKDGKRPVSNEKGKEEASDAQEEGPEQVTEAELQLQSRCVRRGCSVICVCVCVCACIQTYPQCNPLIPFQWQSEIRVGPFQIPCV